MSREAEDVEINNGNSQFLGNIHTELLEEEENNIENIHKTALPQIEIIVFERKYLALIDTGSQITAISEKLWKNIEKQNNTKEIPRLPVTHLTIIGACGKKPQQIKTQIKLPIKIENVKINIHFFIVPKLNLDIVIGCDVLKSKLAEVDFNTGSIKLKINTEQDYDSIDEDNSDEGYEIQKTIITKFKETYGSLKLNIIKNQTIEKEDCLETGFLDKIEIDNDMKISEINESIKNCILNESNKENLKTILKKHTNILSDRPGRCSKFSYQINTIPHTIYKNNKTYPIPMSKRKAVGEEIKRMLEEKIIISSDSPYNSPLVAVIKKTGDVRLCLDSREINKIIQIDNEKPRPIEELLYKCNKIKYMSSIDLVASFLQIPLEPQSRKYTAFTFEGKNYEFTVVPFGLSISTASFVKALSVVLGSECETFTINYVDDVCIVSETEEEHLKHIDIILNKIASANMTVNIKKSEFGVSQLKFLGYVLSNEGVSMQKEKVELIKSFKAPKTRKEVQSFLGLCNFYRRFIKKYAHVVEPISRLIKEKQNFIWEREQNEAFENFKLRFAEDIYLQMPDYEKPFFIRTDASDIGIGGELFQYTDEHPRPIMFISRLLNKYEKNYCCTEKELLAIVYACQKFRIFIEGYKTILLTDHHSLKFLWESKWKSQRLIRWMLYLQSFHFDVDYIKGKDNVVADSLSRYLCSEERVEDSKIFMGAINKKTNKYKEILNRIQKEQVKDNSLKVVIGMLGNNRKLRLYYKYVNNVLFIDASGEKYNWKVCIPENMVIEIIWLYHKESAHQGINKTLQLLKTECHFNNMKRLVKREINKCELCKRIKYDHLGNKPKYKPHIAERPLDVVSIDIFGPLPMSRGKDKLLVVLDNFSKFIKLYPIRKLSSKSMIARMKEFIKNYGKMKTILSDNATIFTSREWYKYFEDTGIKVKHIPPYFPQGNPVERYNLEIAKYLRLFSNYRHKHWGFHIETIENILNNMPHSITRVPPVTALTGEKTVGILKRELKFPDEEQINHEEIIKNVKKHLEHAANRRAKKFQGDKTIEYKVGDIVYIRNHCLSNRKKERTKKLEDVYKGPYNIKRRIGTNSYEIFDINNNKSLGIQNIKNLKSG